MTGSMQVMMASGESGPVSLSVTLKDTRAGATCSASITLAAGGWIGLTGNASSMTAPNWYEPPALTQRMWAQLTNNGAPPTSGNGTTISSTDFAPNWQWQTSVAGPQTLTANPIIRVYSDVGGTVLVSTIYVTVSVVRS